MFLCVFTLHWWWITKLGLVSVTIRHGRRLSAKIHRGHHSWVHEQILHWILSLCTIFACVFSLISTPIKGLFSLDLCTKTIFFLWVNKQTPCCSCATVQGCHMADRLPTICSASSLFTAQCTQSARWDFVKKKLRKLCMQLFS